MPTAFHRQVSLRSLLFVLVLSLAGACSDNSDNNTREPEGPAVDPDYPDYALVELEAGDGAGDEFRAQLADLPHQPGS